MSFQDLAEQAAAYAQRIMELERQLGECSGAVQTMERQIDSMAVNEAEKISRILARIERAQNYYMNEYRRAVDSNKPGSGQYSRIAAAYEHCHGLICHEFGLESPWPLDEEHK
jgi:hypothetical protein